MSFSLETVRAVARLLDEAQLSEITVESTNQTNETAPQRLVVRREVAVLTAGNEALSSAAAPSAAAENVPLMPETQNATVSSPAVGFFRPAPKPVGEGASVKAGQKLGSVQTINVHNDVTAPANGRVLEILVTDAQGVEFGQALFVIEPEA